MMRLTGTPAAPGLAAGPVVRLDPARRSDRRAGSPAEERTALVAALEAARSELDAMVATATSEEARGIVGFQIALLEDQVLTDPVFAEIAQGVAADVAWRGALDAQVRDFAASEDGYFQGRSADVADLRDRVVERLTGVVSAEIPTGAIVISDDIAPSRFLATAWNGGGLVLLRGSATSHVAILARAQGVPMLVGVGTAHVEGHRRALLDGERGELILDPDAATRADFECRRAELASRRVVEAGFLDRPAITAAGERIQVMVNIAGPEELERLDPRHCDGIGLVRTEFLFHGRAQLPDEEEQTRVYSRILAWAGERPVTIRTLDAGGDKPIPGLTRERESNPFLGVRGVRLALRHKDVFRTQLRALARAATLGTLKVMVPMVTVSTEMTECRALLDSVVAELALERVPAKRPPFGMMIEVPAAALAIEEFDADFFSIGSNDLIQYLTASSRDEPELAHLAQPTTAFWKLVRDATTHGRHVGREVSLCGDLAADPRHIPDLIRCGLRSLSVTPAALASVKATIARCETDA